jgi:O-antigen/teichoic acid export membrane protein
MTKLIADKERFKRVLEKSLSLLSLIAIPATVGGVLLSREIIVILYGKDYLPAVASFRLMCLTFLPIFLSSMFGNALFSLNKERKLFTYVIAGILGNFLFNLILIPLFGIEGAALSTVINQTIITLYLLYVLRKEFHFSVLSQLWKIILATIIMGVGVMAVRSLGINIYVITVLSLFLYFGFLYLFRESSLHETANLIKKSLSTPTT